MTTPTAPLVSEKSMEAGKVGKRKAGKSLKWFKRKKKKSRGRKVSEID